MFFNLSYTTYVNNTVNTAIVTGCQLTNIEHNIQPNKMGTYNWI